MGESWVEGPASITIAVLCTVASVAISLANVRRHLLWWTDPRTQRYIVRILLIAAVYAVCSCIALPLGESAVYVIIVRDVFEAFIIYVFLALVLEYAGGDLACIDAIKVEKPIAHPVPLCCLPRIRRDGRFLRFCKQGTLQFVFLKPVMGILSIIMLSKDLYYGRGFQVTMLVVYNLSYSIALYCLLLFYMATHQLYERHSPVLKFVSIKAMVFATYWQSVLVNVSPGTSHREALAWNNFLLCCEMVVFSAMLYCAFGVNKGALSSMPDTDVLNVLDNAKAVLSVKDLLTDAYTSFMPTYQDYMLQRNEDEEPVRYRARTFIVGTLDDYTSPQKPAADAETGAAVEMPKPPAAPQPAMRSADEPSLYTIVTDGSSPRSSIMQ